MFHYHQHSRFLGLTWDHCKRIVDFKSDSGLWTRIDVGIVRSINVLCAHIHHYLHSMDVTHHTDNGCISLLLLDSLFLLLFQFVFWITPLPFWFALQFRHAQNVLRNDRAIVMRWFTNNGKPSVNKIDGKCLIILFEIALAQPLPLSSIGGLRGYISEVVDPTFHQWRLCFLFE